MIYKVHELAKILQISTAATKQWLKKYGTEAKSHMSRVSEDVAEKLIKEFKISPHHKTYSKRIKETELYQLASDYKIFIDTCSLLHSGAEAIFSKKLLQVLSETNNKIIIPTKVIEEIYNHTKSQNLELKKRSHYAINTKKTIL
jgi:predicted transcriptional regulator